MIRAIITIRLKKNVLDPEGKAIAVALQNLGFGGVDHVRKGKIIEMNLSSDNHNEAKQQVQQMCEKLLCNKVIEDYEFEILRD